MAEILQIQSPVVYDESIAHYEIHAHQPFNKSFNNNDEIRISIQHQDLSLLPSRSELHITGRLTNTAEKDVPANTTLVNNAICHLFKEIRYEINGVEIDRCKNVGMTTLMKGWASFRPSQKMFISNAGWFDITGNQNITNAAGYFDVSIPLSMILGFAEDYTKIVTNIKHELVLTRTSSDLNAVIQTPTKAAAAGSPAEYAPFKIKLDKIEWLMPYVVLSDNQKVLQFNYFNQDPIIPMSFRSWEMFEYPTLPDGTEHVWTIKTSNQLEKPRFVIVGFQTARKDLESANASQFDRCNITDVKLFLNSQYYPYGNLNLDYDKNQYALLYKMFINFQRVYYERDAEPILSKEEFYTYMPLIVIDCSKQNESIKNAPVDVRLEFKSKENFQRNTTAYCLIIHDRIIEYSPINGEVRKLS